VCKTHRQVGLLRLDPQLGVYYPQRAVPAAAAGSLDALRNRARRCGGLPRGASVLERKSIAAAAPVRAAEQPRLPGHQPRRCRLPQLKISG